MGNCIKEPHFIQSLLLYFECIFQLLYALGFAQFSIQWVPKPKIGLSQPRSLDFLLAGGEPLPTNFRHAHFEKTRADGVAMFFSVVLFWLSLSSIFGSFRRCQKLFIPKPASFTKTFPSPLFINRLALLWFHTIVRPFFGLDGSNVRSGADAAQRLIDSSKPEYADAALFLFFQGRVDRLKVIKYLSI